MVRTGLDRVISNTKTLAFIGDDETLAIALKANQPGSREALFDKYAHHVKGVLVRTLGTNVDLHDHLHNVFIEAFSSTQSLRDNRKLKSWLTSITVFTAIAHIRKSSKRRWLIFSPPSELPEMVAPVADADTRYAVRLVYEVLEQMPAEERVPFSLRIIDGMPLADVAEACRISLATVKRRIAKARQRFSMLAGKYPQLSELLESGDKWRTQ